MFLSSQHLSAQNCIGIVRRYSILVTPRGKKVKFSKSFILCCREKEGESFSLKIFEEYVPSAGLLYQFYPLPWNDKEVICPLEFSFSNKGAGDANIGKKTSM